ncbi:hypothetical protein [Pseudomonas sp. MYb185]|uniref:hypothetical protein n=1 Tax=Pseudomonas sp. MYb185 TaxID=1848729 RepID=UPI0011B03DC1|nr:hypothetical protein [Pseudomonas sp. MYb185]
MAVTYYGPGEHPVGFIGFRVTAGFNGDFHQRYFSTSAAAQQADEDVIFLSRRLEAELQDLEWRRDSLQYRYQRFVSEDHSNTLPERGVGVHGITAAFVRRGRGALASLLQGGQVSSCNSLSPIIKGISILQAFLRGVGGGGRVLGRGAWSAFC